MPNDKEHNGSTIHFENELEEHFIELKNITMEFHGGTIKALENIDFYLKPREVVGLVGDNGAGKSTLIKILSGVLQPTAGKIFIKGMETRFGSSKDAMDVGIETIFQDMNLIDSMNIMRNIFCGREETSNIGFLKMREMEKKAMHLLEKEVTIRGIDSPKKLVGTLSGGQKQAVAIARAMFFKNRILLFDEPTSALSVRETQAFLNHVTQLRNEGYSIVLVTHNIYHAYQVSDRFYILSHGKKILDVNREDTNIEELTEIIINK
jgi:simple sugar transport system ATP-binding protein